MLPEIKLSVGLISSFLKFLKRIIPVIKNYVSRPKIKIEVKNHVFVGKDGNHIHGQAILISNNKPIKINFGLSKINNEVFYSIVMNNNNYAKDNIDCEIFDFIRKNWNEVHQKTINMDLEAFKTLILPIDFRKNNNLIFNHKKNSSLFFPSKKVSITLNINNKNYEYGLSLYGICALVMNTINN